MSEDCSVGRALPVIVDTADADGPGAASAIAWTGLHRERIEAHLNDEGAVLIRGFRISSPEHFRAVCSAIRPDLAAYRGGDSPRTTVADRVYTSSEYPAHLEVFLHNELSYAGWSPDRVFFGCVVPSASGGQTHLADGREIFSRLDPVVRERFQELGVRYLQHLWDEEGRPGIGKSWQETFETSDRGVAEEYLYGAEMTFEWTDLGIRTVATHPAVLQHGFNGELCWHNQADQWHRDILGVKVVFDGTNEAPFDGRTAGVGTLGNHVTYGDGSEIDVDDLLHIRQVSLDCEVSFDWQAGDLLAIDNVSTMHGRKPFTGPRRVLVAMA